MGADHGDDDPEKQGFDQPAPQVLGREKQPDPVKVDVCRHPDVEIRRYAACEDSCEVCDDGQCWQDHHAGEDARQDEEPHGVDAHAFERIDLFRDPHRAYLRGYACAYATRNYESGQYGSELDHHHLGDRHSDIIEWRVTSSVIAYLDGGDQS